MLSVDNLFERNDYEGITWDTYYHPDQDWEIVDNSIWEYNLDRTNPYHILWARLFANNVDGIKNANAHPLLSSETMNDLAADAQILCDTGCYDRARGDKCGSCESKALLVAYSQRFVSKQVKTYIFGLNFGFDYQDLKQAGNLGLLKAIETWEIDGGMDFLGWSKYSIKQELRAMITNDGMLLRIPAAKRILQSKLPKIREELTAELGYNPSYTEMSVYIRCQDYDKGCQTKLIPPEEIAFLENFQFGSLNMKINTEDDEELELQDVIEGKAEDPAKTVATTDLVERLLGSLSENEEIVVRNFKESPLGKSTAKEVAELLPPSPRTGEAYTEASVSSMWDRAKNRMYFEAINLGFKTLGECLE